MAYIWGFGRIPDYLTTSRDMTRSYDKRMNDKIFKGEPVDILTLYFETSRKCSNRITAEKILGYDILNSASSVIQVNTKVLRILEKECAGKFQAIPTVIKLPDGSEVTDYWVINVIHKLPIVALEDCVRHRKFADEQDIRASIFYTVVYKGNIVEKEDLCRDSILGKNLICISERLYKIFKKERLKGMGFHKNLSDSVIFV